VDDLPGGATDAKKGYNFYQQAKEIMKRGGLTFGNGGQTTVPYSSRLTRQKVTLTVQFMGW